MEDEKVSALMWVILGVFLLFEIVVGIFFSFRFVSFLFPCGFLSTHLVFRIFVYLQRINALVRYARTYINWWVFNHYRTTYARFLFHLSFYGLLPVFSLGCVGCAQRLDINDAN